MPELTQYIDAIARQKQRNVLYLVFDLDVVVNPSRTLR